MSYGVLQESYATDLRLQGSSRLTGLIGTTLNGVLYLSLPFLSTLFSNHLSQWRRTATIIGLFITSAGLTISASSTAVWHLIITQGILCGIGSALMYSPTTIYLDEWFIRRKSFAYSVTLAAKNIVGTATPFMTPALISSVGIRNTLRIWGVITFITGILAIPMLHSRTDPNTTPRTRASRRATPWKFLTHPTFYIFHLANIVFSSGYGLPQTYLPSYGRQILHMSPAESASTLAIFNFPGIISCIAFGMLGDGVPIFGYSPTPFTITFLSAIGSALSAFLLWGLASRANVAGLALFSATYGFFASAYSSTWGGALKEIEREATAHNEAVDTGIVYALLNGGRGLGFVAGGFAGIQLLKTGPIRGSSEGGYGTDYGSVILYTGISAAVGGWSVLWSRRLRCR